MGEVGGVPVPTGLWEVLASLTPGLAAVIALLWWRIGQLEKKADSPPDSELTLHRITMIEAGQARADQTLRELHAITAELRATVDGVKEIVGSISSIQIRAKEPAGGWNERQNDRP